MKFLKQQRIILCLKIIKKLIALFFRMYENQDYRANHLSYERTIIRFSLQFFKRSQGLNFLALENLFEILMQLGSLRYRVVDPSTFGVMSPELKSIHDTLMQAVDATIARKAVVQDLKNVIEHLNAVYDTTLKVVAGDPLVFLFWMESLNAFHHQLVHFYD